MLLDPGLGVSPEQALAGAERERQDWSFATPEGAANAPCSSPKRCVATPPRSWLPTSPKTWSAARDGRLRFRYCPGALVVAWSEMALLPPPVAAVADAAGAAGDVGAP